jgi:hypothetical protein
VARESVPSVAVSTTGQGGGDRNKVLIGVVVLVGIGVIANLGGGGEPPRTPTPRPAAAATPTQGSEPTVAPEPTAETSLQPEPTVAPPVSASFEDIELTGRGDKVAKFTIPDEAVGIARLTHQGSSNFIVETIDASGDTNELLVNEIGRYVGNHLFDTTSHSVAVKITADGQWRALIRPITAARAWDPARKVEGEGADVVQLTPASEGLVTLSLRHRGESNFVVMAYTTDGDRELLVNEIGNYSGEVLLSEGTFLLTVEADGAWTGTPG